MIQSGGFLGRLLGPLLKTGLPLTKNVTKPLVKSVLIPLWLTAAEPDADAGIHNKILGSDHRHSFSLVLCIPLHDDLHNTTTLIISNDKMKDLIEVVKSFEDSGLILKGLSETIQNENKEQKRQFLSMLFGTLCASLLRNILTGKRINRAGECSKSVSEETKSKRQGQGMVRTGYGNKKVWKTKTKNKKKC